MSQEIGILLMSHGDFAKEALKSGELIVGKQKNIATLGVHLEDDLAELTTRLMRKVASLDTTRGLVVVTDIVGGTPMNLTANLVGIENLLISSGLNLPLLLELFLNREQELVALRELMENAYRTGQTIRTQEDFIEGDEDDDQIL